METTRNFISSFAEFSSGMKGGHNSFKRGDFCLFVNINRNASAVVRYSYFVFREENDFNIIGKSTHGLVAGVVKNLPNKVMKPV